jgi:hypothetical protein
VGTDGLGNVYISGYSSGSLGGPNAGGRDAFLSKYDSAGNRLWIRQLGSSDSDSSYGVAVDAPGNAYMAGYIEGAAGSTADAFVSKLDPAGNVIWSRGGTSWDVALDPLGNVLACGQASGIGGYGDFLVSKYDPAGSLTWTRQFGSANSESVSGVAADGSGNVYLSGSTRDPYVGGLNDILLCKYDAAGNLAWHRQLGSPSGEYDTSTGVAADASGNVYVTGWTSGSIGGQNAGNTDTFLLKYNTTGDLVWTRQLGTSGCDQAGAIAVDQAGRIYITGYTSESLNGPSAGNADVFVAKFDAGGSMVWTCQFGSSDYDNGWGITVDALGNVYVTGCTLGSLGGPSAGYFDAFLVKVPEPATLSLLAIGGLAILKRGRK